MMGIPGRDGLAAMIETLYGQIAGPAVVSNECGSVINRSAEDIIKAISFLESKHEAAAPIQHGEAAQIRRWKHSEQPGSGLENWD